MLGPPPLALLLYLAQSPAPQVSIGGRTPSPLPTPQALLLPLPLASPTLPMPLLQHTHHHRGLQQSGQGVILAVSSREGDGRTIEIYVSTEFSSLSVAVIGRYERVVVMAPRQRLRPRRHPRRHPYRRRPHRRRINPVLHLRPRHNRRTLQVWRRSRCCLLWCPAHKRCG